MKKVILVMCVLVLIASVFAIASNHEDQSFQNPQEDQESAPPPTPEKAFETEPTLANFQQLSNPSPDQFAQLPITDQATYLQGAQYNHEFAARFYSGNENQIGLYPNIDVQFFGEVANHAANPRLASTFFTGAGRVENIRLLLDREKRDAASIYFTEQLGATYEITAVHDNFEISNGMIRNGVASYPIVIFAGKSGIQLETTTDGIKIHGGKKTVALTGTDPVELTGYDSVIGVVQLKSGDDTFKVSQTKEGETDLRFDKGQIKFAAGVSGTGVINGQAVTYGVNSGELIIDNHGNVVKADNAEFSNRQVFVRGRFSSNDNIWKIHDHDAEQSVLVYKVIQEDGSALAIGSAGQARSLGESVEINIDELSPYSSYVKADKKQADGPETVSDEEARQVAKDPIKVPLTGLNAKVWVKQRGAKTYVQAAGPVNINYQVMAGNTPIGVDNTLPRWEGEEGSQFDYKREGIVEQFIQSGEGTYEDDGVISETRLPNALVAKIPGRPSKDNRNPADVFRARCVEACDENSYFGQVTKKVAVVRGTSLAGRDALVNVAEDSVVEGTNGYVVNLFNGKDGVMPMQNTKLAGDLERALEQDGSQLVFDKGFFLETGDGNGRNHFGITDKGVGRFESTKAGLQPTDVSRRAGVDFRAREIMGDEVLVISRNEQDSLDQLVGVLESQNFRQLGKLDPDDYSPSVSKLVHEEFGFNPRELDNEFYASKVAVYLEKTAGRQDSVATWTKTVTESPSTARRQVLQIRQLEANIALLEAESELGKNTEKDVRKYKEALGTVRAQKKQADRNYLIKKLESATGDASKAVIKEIQQKDPELYGRLKEAERKAYAEAYQKAEEEHQARLQEAAGRIAGGLFNEQETPLLGQAWEKGKKIEKLQQKIGELVGQRQGRIASFERADEKGFLDFFETKTGWQNKNRLRHQYEVSTLSVDIENLQRELNRVADPEDISGIINGLSGRPDAQAIALQHLGDHRSSAALLRQSKAVLQEAGLSTDEVQLKIVRARLRGGEDAYSIGNDLTGFTDEAGRKQAEDVMHDALVVAPLRGLRANEQSTLMRLEDANSFSNELKRTAVGYAMSVAELVDVEVFATEQGLERTGLADNKEAVNEELAKNTFERMQVYDHLLVTALNAKTQEQRELVLASLAEGEDAESLKLAAELDVLRTKAQGFQLKEEQIGRVAVARVIRQADLDYENPTEYMAELAELEHQYSGTSAGSEATQAIGVLDARNERIATKSVATDIVTAATVVAGFGGITLASDVAFIAGAKLVGTGVKAAAKTGKVVSNIGKGFVQGNIDLAKGLGKKLHVYEPSLLPSAVPCAIAGLGASVCTPSTFDGLRARAGEIGRTDIVPTFARRAYRKATGRINLQDLDAVEFERINRKVRSGTATEADWERLDELTAASTRSDVELTREVRGVDPGTREVPSVVDSRTRARTAIDPNDPNVNTQRRAFDPDATTARSADDATDFDLEIDDVDDFDPFPARRVDDFEVDADGDIIIRDDDLAIEFEAKVQSNTLVEVRAVTASEPLDTVPELDVIILHEPTFPNMNGQQADELLAGYRGVIDDLAERPDQLEVMGQILGSEGAETAFKEAGRAQELRALQFDLNNRVYGVQPVQTAEADRFLSTYRGIIDGATDPYELSVLVDILQSREAAESFIAAGKRVELEIMLNDAILKRADLLSPTYTASGVSNPDLFVNHFRIETNSRTGDVFLAQGEDAALLHSKNLKGSSEPLGNGRHVTTMLYNKKTGDVTLIGAENPNAVTRLSEDGDLAVVAILDDQGRIVSFHEPRVVRNGEITDEVAATGDDLAGVENVVERHYKEVDRSGNLGDFSVCGTGAVVGNAVTAAATVNGPCIRGPSSTQASVGGGARRVVDGDDARLLGELGPDVSLTRQVSGEYKVVEVGGPTPDFLNRFDFGPHGGVSREGRSLSDPAAKAVKARLYRAETSLTTGESLENIVANADEVASVKIPSEASLPDIVPAPSYPKIPKSAKVSQPSMRSLELEETKLAPGEDLEALASNAPSLPASTVRDMHPGDLLPTEPLVKYTPKTRVMLQDAGLIFELDGVPVVVINRPTQISDKAKTVTKQMRLKHLGNPLTDFGLYQSSSVLRKDPVTGEVGWWQIKVGVDDGFSKGSNFALKDGVKRNQVMETWSELVGVRTTKTEVMQVGDLKLELAPVIPEYNSFGKRRASEGLESYLDAGQNPIFTNRPAPDLEVLSPEEVLRLQQEGYDQSALNLVTISRDRELGVGDYPEGPRLAGVDGEVTGWGKRGDNEYGSWHESTPYHYTNVLTQTPERFIASNDVITTTFNRVDFYHVGNDGVEVFDQAKFDEVVQGILERGNYVHLSSTPDGLDLARGRLRALREQGVGSYPDTEIADEVAEFQRGVLELRERVRTAIDADGAPVVNRNGEVMSPDEFIADERAWLIGRGDNPKDLDLPDVPETRTVTPAQRPSALREQDPLRNWRQEIGTKNNIDAAAARAQQSGQPEIKVGDDIDFKFTDRDGNAIEAVQRLTVDGDGKVKIAIIDTSSGTEIASHTYLITENGKSLDVWYTQVEGPFQGAGLNTQMYQQMSDLHPDFGSIESTLDQSNLLSYRNYLGQNPTASPLDAVLQTPAAKVRQRAGWEIDLENSVLPGLNDEGNVAGFVKINYRRSKPQNVVQTSQGDVAIQQSGLAYEFRDSLAVREEVYQALDFENVVGRFFSKGKLKEPLPRYENYIRATYPDAADDIIFNSNSIAIQRLNRIVDQYNARLADGATSVEEFTQFRLEFERALRFVEPDTGFIQRAGDEVIPIGLADPNSGRAVASAEDVGIPCGGRSAAAGGAIATGLSLAAPCPFTPGTPPPTGIRSGDTVRVEVSDGVFVNAKYIDGSQQEGLLVVSDGDGATFVIGAPKSVKPSSQSATHTIPSVVDEDVALANVGLSDVARNQWGELVREGEPLYYKEYIRKVYADDPDTAEAILRQVNPETEAIYDNLVDKFRDISPSDRGTDTIVEFSRSTNDLFYKSPIRTASNTQTGTSFTSEGPLEIILKRDNLEAASEIYLTGESRIRTIYFTQDERGITRIVDPGEAEAIRETTGGLHFAIFNNNEVFVRAGREPVAPTPGVPIVEQGLFPAEDWFAEGVIDTLRARNLDTKAGRERVLSKFESDLFNTQKGKAFLESPEGAQWLDDNRRGWYDLRGIWSTRLNPKTIDLHNLPDINEWWRQQNALEAIAS